MAASRPPKGRKPFTDNSSPVQGNRGSRGLPWNRGGGPNFPNAPRQNNQFPPLAGPQGRPETGYDPKLLATLASVIGQPVIVSLKSGARHEGVVAAIIAEGDAAGVTLKDCRDLSNPTAALRESFVLPASNIASWNQLRMTNGADTFRTDTDISSTNASANPKERELQQWQPEPATATAASLAALQGDEATFGPPGIYSGAPWDQFEVNERLFGVNPKFDEEAYTTKLDRSAPGFKEKERKAEQIANEITSGSTSNPHVAEERVMNGTENGIGEEEKFSAVVRTPGAYVPPGARRNGSGPVPTQATPAPEAAPPVTPATNGTSTPTPAAALIPTISGPTPEDTAGKPQTEGLVANFRDFVTNEKHRLAQRKQAMVKTEMDKRKADLLKFSKNFKLSRPIPEDLVPILAKDEEKQRAIREKAIADALASQNRTAGPSTGAPAAPTTTSSGSPSREASQKSVAKPAAQADSQVKKPKGGMVIQAIPPFDKNKVRKTAATGTSAAPASSTSTALAQPTPGPSAAPAIQAIPASPTAAQANSRLNANASIFKPNANAAVFKPTTPGPTPSPKQREPSKEIVQPAPVSGPPNPFYGARAPTKKGASVHLKDEFNPFRHAKVGDASQVSSIWPYNGKRFAALHPPTTGMHVAPGPNMPNPLVPGPPPQSHDEDPNMQQGPGRQMPPLQQQQQAQQQQQQQQQAQQQQQQQQQQAQQQQQQPPQYPIMYFPPYPPYSPAPPGQPPMMMPPNSPYMAGPYMHPVAYPHHMPPNGSMYGPPPGMPGVPPTPHYMPHSPFGQASPPPAGTPRGPGPMQPQQMPPHAYYHPSPQMTHAMPYQMMMPPPGPHFDPTTQGPLAAPPQSTPMGH